MKLLTVVVFWFSLFLPLFNLQAEESFSELGQRTVLEKFVVVERDIESFSYSTNWKSSKKLRKDIGNLKLLLDVFSHAYSKKGLGKKDSWAYLREQLDVGYEVFGNYKDIYDTSQTTGDDISEIEKEELFKVTNEWREGFLKKVVDEEFIQYLEEQNNELIFRKKKGLPKYIWRRLDFSPDQELSGAENLRKMIKGLLQLGSEDLDDLYEIKKLTKHKNEETFHDWRKGLRIVLRLNSFFPQISDYLSQSQQDLALLDQAIDKFGDLNDLLVAYHKKGSKKIKKQIKIQWRELKDWLQEQKMEDVLRNLKYAISVDE